MIALKEIADGEFSELALTIGTQLLEKLPPVSKWDEIWTGQVIEAIFIGNGLDNPPEVKEKQEEETKSAGEEARDKEDEENVGENVKAGEEEESAGEDAKEGFERAMQ